MSEQDEQKPESSEFALLKKEAGQTVISLSFLILKLAKVIIGSVIIAGFMKLYAAVNGITIPPQVNYYLGILGLCVLGFVGIKSYLSDIADLSPESIKRFIEKRKQKVE